MSIKPHLFALIEQQLQVEINNQSTWIELAWRVHPKKFVTSDKQNEWDYLLMKEVVSISSHIIILPVTITSNLYSTRS